MFSKMELGGWITAIMLSLGGGAIWSVVGLTSDGIAAKMAIPCAVLILIGLRFIRFHRRTSAVLAGLFLYFLCASYAQYLLVSTSISQYVGINFAYAFQHAGIEFAFATIKERFTEGDWIWLICGGFTTGIFSAFAYRKIQQKTP